MEPPPDHTRSRKRGPRSAASSSSPESPRPSARTTPDTVESTIKRARREGEDRDHGPHEHRGHIARNNIARGHATVQYGDNHYHGMIQRRPDTVENKIKLALESLEFDQMESRRETISNTYSNTCEWLFQMPEYLNWRNPATMSEHCGFFWIKSKPGAGKSTLMKFFFGSAQQQLPEDVVICFFFNARGEALERSLEGLYRSLLHQLLTTIPRLQESLKSLLNARSNEKTWTLESLKTLLTSAVMGLKQDRLTCLIDALDECPEDEIRDLVDFFEDLGESAARKYVEFRVCFSSRHYPHVTMNKCQHMLLDGQEGHQHDIAQYVQKRLKVGKSKTGNALRDAVRDKAQGVFMWVVLAVRILNQESDRGSSDADLRRCLDRTPSKLHDLFQDILHRGIEDSEALLPMLQWIYFAAKPLTREELFFAIRSGHTKFDVAKPWDDQEDTAESMDLFILNASKGLAEMTMGARPTVQFIHESVRDYLHRDGFGTIAPQLKSNLKGITHEYLKQCCCRALAIDMARPSSTRKAASKGRNRMVDALRNASPTAFPFLHYALGNILYHANSACSYGIPQLDFVDSFSWDIWSTLDAITKYNGDRLSAPLDTFIYALVQKGANALLQLELQLERSRLISAIQLEHTLRLAIRKGNSQALVLIFASQAVNTTFHSNRTETLALAIKMRCTEGLRVLLRHQPQEASISLEERNALLSHAHYTLDWEIRQVLLQGLDGQFK